MKKIYLLTLALSSLSVSVLAQIPKKSIWLGGNLGFLSSKNQTGESFKNNYYSISPAIGKAIKENMILGVQVNFDHSIFKNAFNDLTVSHYGLDIFERKYWTIVKRLYAFGHFNLGYNAEKRQSVSQNFKEEGNGWKIGLGAGPGLSFELSRRFQLETMLSDLFFFSYSQSETESTDPNSTISKSSSRSISGGVNFDNSSNLTLGVRFLLKKSNPDIN